MVQNETLLCPSCGKSINRDQKFCPFCGVKLSKQFNVEGSIDSSLMNISKEDKSELDRLMQEQDEKEIAKFIRNLFQRISSHNDDLSEMYDLIGEKLIKHPVFFKEQLYRRLYNNSFPFSYPSQTISEMEKYILRKFSLYDGERLIDSTKGILTIGGHKIIGNLYFSNQRMIMCGTLKRRGTADGGSGTDADFIIFILWIFALFYFAIRWALTRWKKILRTQINKKKPCFGYEFPFVEVQDVELKKRKIKFKLKYEYKFDGQIKTKIVKLKFKPERKIGFKEKEDKAVYRERRERFLSNFYQFLKQL